MYVQRYSRLFVVKFCRRLSSLPESVSTEVVEHPKNTSKKKKTLKRVPHSHELHYFFTAYPHLDSIKKFIPSKYFVRGNTTAPDNIYLICPKIAKKVANIVFPYLRSTRSQVIAETNAGLGLITSELLDKGVDLIRFYENCPEFREELKEFADVYPGRVELFTKSIFHLHRYAFMDKIDNGDRIEALLRGVPRRNWSDDPVMTIIGTLSNLSFLKYLVRAISLQAGPALYGRMQLFVMMKARDYAILSATPKDNLFIYNAWAVLFSLFFDYDLLEEFPRKMFLPWDPHVDTQGPYHTSSRYDRDKMYLVNITMKQELPVPADQLLPLFFFVKQFFGKGNIRIIPTLEKWVPDSGLSILAPKIKHIDYYQPMGIFTTFRELKPHQILFVFNEMVNNPAYLGSPFTDMVENELIKSETIETSLADATLEKTIHGDNEKKPDVT